MVLAARQLQAFAALAGVHAQRGVEGGRGFKPELVAGRQIKWLQAGPGDGEVFGQRRLFPACVQQVAPAVHHRAGPGESGLGVGTGCQQSGFDGCAGITRQRRQFEAGDPGPQQPGAPGRRFLHQCRQRQRGRVQPLGPGQAALVFAGQQVGLLRQQMRAAGQRQAGLRPALGQARQHVVAQEVAVVPVGFVRRVFQPVQGVLAGVGLQGLARHVQQRSPQPAVRERAQRPHRRQAVAGAAQQAQQHGFGLVVAVVGGDQQFARGQRAFEGGVAGRACGGFQALA